MKPLQFSRYLLSLLCIYPAEDPSSKWILFRNSLFGILTALHLLLAAIAAAAASYKYLAVDFESALYAFPECIAVSMSNYTFIMGFISRKEIQEMFDLLQEIYDTYKEKDLKHFMARADHRGTRTAKFFVKYFAGICPIGVMFVGFLSMIYSRFSYGYINPDVLFHPAVILLPWDQNHVVGWAFETVYCISWLALLLFVNPLFLSLFYSICEYHEAFLNIFRIQVQEIDTKIENANLSNYELKVRVHGLIAFHVAVGNFFQKSAEVYSTFIFIQLMGAMVIMACYIFHFDLALRHLDLAVCIMGVALAAGETNLFLYCYHGGRTTANYLEFTDCIYGVNWVQLPVQLQKLFIIMIAQAQKPLFYCGSGIIQLDLAVFGSLMKTIISYYLMFKTLTGE